MPGAIRRGEAASLAVEFAAGTDLGCVRTSNEDSFGYDLVRQIYVVCDGMGGMAAGEVASATAVRDLLQSFNTESEASLAAPAETRLQNAIHAANRSVHQSAVTSEHLRGMGTTLVCACLDGSRIIIGNVGDSRAYFLRDGQCFQVTQDHSIVAEQLREGLITPEMAEVSELRSMITRAVGVADSVEPDLFAAEVQEGDMVLLASDGLTRYTSEKEIGQVMGGEQTIQSQCSHFVALARERGGADNITCLILRIIRAAAGA
jgi:serine/threonine protein phosphatase PrpC